MGNGPAWRAACLRLSHLWNVYRRFVRPAVQRTFLPRPIGESLELPAMGDEGQPGGGRDIHHAGPAESPPGERPTHAHIPLRPVGRVPVLWAVLQLSRRDP